MGLQFFPEPEADEQAVRDLTREFVDGRIRPTAIEDDEKCVFRRDVVEEMAKLGLTALSIPTSYGGQGKSYRCYYGSLEEVARGSLSLAVTIGVTNLIQGALLKFGNEEQKKRYLVPLVKGELLGAFSLSEPQAGSDATALRLSARKVSGGYVLNGSKCWCSSAGYADLYLVMGRTGEHRTKGVTAFLVPKQTAGFRVGKQEKKLGLRSSSLAELIFEDAFVPDDHVVATEGRGIEVALSELDAGRITIGTGGVGIAIEAIERAWRYRHTAAGNGWEFDDGTRHALAEHYAAAQAARALVNAAAIRRDQGKPFTVIASQVKLLGSDLAMRVTSDAVTWMGEAGYTREYEVERLMRDAKALQIVEGTNQIQKLVLAREMTEMLS